MAKQPDVSRAIMASTTPPRTTSTTHDWDDKSALCDEVASHTFTADGGQPCLQARGPHVTAQRDKPYWTTEQISRVPALSRQKIAWEKEAALMTFSLLPVLHAATAHTVLPEATGNLVCFPCQKPTAPSTSAVHPVLLVHTPYASFEAEHVRIALSLPAHDPLLRHISLVLQTVIEGKDVVVQLFAAVLIDALVAHFLRRFATMQLTLDQASGGLAPSKLRCVLAYIQNHLEQKLSLPALAAVAQMSPAHFARLFKQATGRSPHQYVITCRMEYAKRLLIETDMPLCDIGPEVGCANQSHFTALFRKHVSMTPQVYRNTTRR